MFYSKIFRRVLRRFYPGEIDRTPGAVPMVASYICNLWFSLLMSFLDDKSDVSFKFHLVELTDATTANMTMFKVALGSISLFSEVK